jgi:hypothetical protein
LESLTQTKRCCLPCSAEKYIRIYDAMHMAYRYGCAFPASAARNKAPRCIFPFIGPDNLQPHSDSFYRKCAALARMTVVLSANPLANVLLLFTAVQFIHLLVIVYRIPKYVTRAL